MKCPAPAGSPVIRERPQLKASIALLTSAGLPASDLTAEHLKNFFYFGAAESPVALIGVELHGGDALLRSLATAPEARSAGLGSALVEHAERYARLKGVRTMYLLTTTAEPFFDRRGYRRLVRAAAAPAIAATREFTELCPASSTLMAKAL